MDTFTVKKGKPFHQTLLGRKIETNEEYLVETQEYQGGATAILQILKTQVRCLMFGNCHHQKVIFQYQYHDQHPPCQMSDAGTYTLRGENRNGSDKVAKVKLSPSLA